MWRRWKKRLPTSVTFLSPSTPVPFSVAANNKDGEDPTRIQLVDLNLGQSIGNFITGLDSDDYVNENFLQFLYYFLQT